MSFAYPYVLLTLGVLIPLSWIYTRRLDRLKIRMPHHPDLLSNSTQARSTTTIRWLRNHAGWGLFCFTLVCLIIALARPRFEQTESWSQQEGLDIYLVIDTSMSMSEQDLNINGHAVDRLTAVKGVVQDFIAARTHDRIGLVIFGSTAYAQAPLTSDHHVLNQFLNEISIGMAGKNTAIGDAIGVASNRFIHVDAASKVMILLTDGANSAGNISPEQAAQAAAGLGIKIYTIAVVGPNVNFLNMRLPIPSFNTEILNYIAKTTGGEFYTASSTAALAKIYQTIDQLETTEAETNSQLFYDDIFMVFLWGALGAFTTLVLSEVLTWRRWP